MPVKQLEEYLQNQNINYITINHARAYCAQEIAACTHIPGNELAKTVMVKVDGKMAMAVLTANDKVDFDLLQKVSGAQRVELADENEFKDLFPGCDIGAMPPFGNLYGMPVFVANTLANEKQITFNAGSHTELVRMAYKDFNRLVAPKAGKLS